MDFVSSNSIEIHQKDCCYSHQKCVYYIQSIHTRGDDMRTNIVIDDQLMDNAISVSGFKTKKETVEDALRLYIKIKDQREILRYKGKIEWEGDLESMRRD